MKKIKHINSQALSENIPLNSGVSMTGEFSTAFSIKNVRQNSCFDSKSQRYFLKYRDFSFLDGFYEIVNFFIPFFRNQTQRAICEGTRIGTYMEVGYEAL